MNIAIKPGFSFSLDDFEKAALGRVRVAASQSALKSVEASHKKLLAATGNPSLKIYSIHTGFGAQQDESPGVLGGAHQRRLIASHACGVGEPLEEHEVRGMLYLRSLQLARGYSGVRPATFKKYLGLLNSTRLPSIPSQGSVGACGDLIPLAHAAWEVFKKMRDHEIGPRDGLALVNGTEASTSVSLLALVTARALVKRGLEAAALSLFALKGKTEAWEEALVSLKKHPASVETGRHLLEILGSYRSWGLPQDPYSLRAVPQVAGCASEVLENSLNLLVREASSVTDNPPVVGGKRGALHGANFHGIFTAAAADTAAMALLWLAQMSERRTDHLLSGMRGLPKMLAMEPAGSGLMMTQVVQAALLEEMRRDAQPASAGSIPTSAGQEDVVPMAMGAALKFKRAALQYSRILAVEVLAASRAVRMSGRLRELESKTRLKFLWAAAESAAGPWLRREAQEGLSRAVEKLAGTLRGREHFHDR